jgi:hypothetical protein
MAQVWCVYDVQGDRDASENAFEVFCSDPDAPTLAELQRSCPFTNTGGDWRWRAKVADDVFGYCWRDVLAQNEPVGVEQSGVVRMRVVDVSPQAIARRRLKPGRMPRARRAAKGYADAPPAPAGGRAMWDEASRANGTRAHVPPPSQRAPPPKPPPRKPSLDMVDLGEAPPPPKKNAQSLNQNDVQQLVREGKMRWDDVDQRYVAVEVVEEVRIGIQAVSIGNEDLSSKSVEVQQAILERRQALQDAQEEKRARLRAQRNAAESEADAQIALKARLDPQLKQWSEDHGKKKNIRALLAGMDQVMWEGSGWKPISIGDLLEPKKVKRAYYKASRFVHPDKLVNLSVEQRFVGKRIFDALSQAYAEFEESGMG